MLTDRTAPTKFPEVERGLFSSILAIAQAATATVPHKPGLAIPQPCETRPSSDYEILVCGRRDTSDRYRIKPSATEKADRPKAETALADGVGLSAETERVDIGGAPSNRVMIRLKFKF